MLDRKKAAALAKQVGVDFGGALTAALAYIGDRLGIFKAMSSGSALTTSQLAQRTGLNERYLREWTATMAAAGYLDYSSHDASFRMNSEQAAVLANEDTTYFTAGAFQYAVACYRQIPKLMEAFRNGGGVPFSDFGVEIVEAIERLFHLGCSRMDPRSTRYSRAAAGRGRSRRGRLRCWPMFDSSRCSFSKLALFWI